MSKKRALQIKRRTRRRERRTKRPISTGPKVLGFRSSRAVAAEKAEPITIDADKAWFIVQTYPNYEERVEERLTTSRLCDVFRPLEAVRRARKGKGFTTTRHLMPRHMFVGLEPWQDPRVVMRDVLGVYDILRINGRDVRIHPAELQSFADVVTDRVGPARGIGTRIMQKGDEVMVIEGPFKQFPAVVLRAAKDGMVSVELRLFGDVHSFDAPLDHLRPAA